MAKSYRAIVPGYKIHLLFMAKWLWRQRCSSFTYRFYSFTALQSAKKTKLREFVSSCKHAKEHKLHTLHWSATIPSSVFISMQSVLKEKARQNSCFIIEFYYNHSVDLAKKSFCSIFTWLEHVQEIIVTGRHSMYDDDVENNDWNIFLNSARRWDFFIIWGCLSSMHPVYFLVNLLL